MGLFSKEICFHCGNKVGALSRIKLKSGEFLCTDCQKLGNPFIHIAYLTRDQAEALLREAKENEAHYQQVRFNFRKTSRMVIGKEWAFYDNFQTGEFVLETPETKNYPNHFVYRMKDVLPFEKADQFLSGVSQFNTREHARQVYYDLITVEEKKGADGKTDSWVLRIPYNREHMTIETKFPGSMAERDVRMMQATIQAVIGNYNTGYNLTPTQLDEIKKNAKSLGRDSAVTNTAQAIGQFFSSLGKK